MHGTDLYNPQCRSTTNIRPIECKDCTIKQYHWCPYFNGYVDDLGTDDKTLQSCISVFYNPTPFRGFP